jgi:hypothetical protein
MGAAHWVLHFAWSLVDSSVEVGGGGAWLRLRWTAEGGPHMSRHYMSCGCVSCGYTSCCCVTFVCGGYLRGAVAVVIFN